MHSRSRGLVEYNLRGYGAMIADRVRMDAYRDALARSVKPGDVVLDVGAGTGILSLIACQLGARTVHAIEPSDALAVGRELAAANGFTDRIRFHYATSRDVTLAERADVMVSDLRGVLPLHGSHLPSIVDARSRLLRPGGVQIPRRDVLMAQLVCDAALHDGAQAAWHDRVLGLDLTPALRWAAHVPSKADLSKSERIGAPCPIIELDYTTLTRADARGQARWTCDADATAHGLGVWFDADLTDGAGFSNAPDRPRTIYNQAFFPFTQPVRLRRGEPVDVTLAATRVGRDYVWQWHVTTQGTTLRQSTFEGSPVDPLRLGPRAAGHVPAASARSRAAGRVLALVERRLPVEEIARQVEAEFPDWFATRSAREFVSDVCDWLAE